MFKALEKEGNVGIKFHEMNTEAVIRKLQVIETNPSEIWRCFNKVNG